MEVIAILSLVAILSLIPGIIKMYRETQNLEREIKRLNIHRI